MSTTIESVALFIGVSIVAIGVICSITCVVLIAIALVLWFADEARAQRKNLIKRWNQ